MQFDRQPDGSLVPLPAPCVDTGMGLERLAAILQHVHTNYEIDLFQALIRKAAELTGTADLENKSLRVIADHIRACSFLIVDGVLPSNEGRGYVLRRIIRRALRHGWMLGVRQPFFSKLVPTLVEQMGEAYPELPAAVDTVTRALQAEEERFAETLDAGMKIFEDVAGKASNGVIPGVDAFRLYDTYGFPLDLTQDIARERDLTVDIAGFDAAMEQQRETARAAGKFGGGVSLPAELVATLSPTRFLGYDRLQADGLTVLALLGRPSGAVGRSRGRGHRHHRPDAVLCRVRRPGRRHGRACRQRRAPGSGRHPEVRRPVPWPCRHPVRRRPEGRRRARRPGRWRAPRRHHPQPLGNAPAACRPARSAGHPRAAEGLAGRSGPPAFRLLALPADQRGRTGADRAQGQPAGARQQRGRSPHHGHAGSAGLRRDGPVRREVWRARARTEDG